MLIALHTSEQYELELNILKVVVIIKSIEQHEMLYDKKEVFEIVSNFTYLGCDINDSLNHYRKIIYNIEKARAFIRIVLGISVRCPLKEEPLATFDAQYKTK